MFLFFSLSLDSQFIKLIWKIQWLQINVFTLIKIIINIDEILMYLLFLFCLFE